MRASLLIRLCNLRKKKQQQQQLLQNIAKYWIVFVEEFQETEFF